MRNENVSNFEKAQLDFYAANIHSFLKSSEVTTTEHLENEIYYLRLSYVVCQENAQEQENHDLSYRVETNLGNSLNSVGRFVEALEGYDSVIEKHPCFGMAHLGKGIALYHYTHLCDKDNRLILAKYSYESLKVASKLGVEEHAEIFCQNYLNHLNNIADWENMPVEIDKKLNCSSTQEVLYRQWCLDNHLF
jgi:tetratricopeptide (TPR) repeat protein